MNLPTGLGYRPARVIRFLQGGKLADIVMLDDLHPYPAVTVTSPHPSSTSSGTQRNPPPTPVASEGDFAAAAAEKVNCLVAFVPTGKVHRPFIVAFWHPMGHEVQFADDAMSVDRLPNDVYEASWPDGSHELRTPSGGMLRFGEGTAHRPLDGLDINKRWKIDRNTGKAISVTLSLEQGGNVVASVVLTPEGDVQAVATRDGSLQARRNASVIAGEDATVQAGDTATIRALHVVLDAPLTTATGDLHVTGDVTTAGNVTALTGTVLGQTVATTKGNSMDTLKVSAVQPGQGTSGPPVPGG